MDSFIMPILSQREICSLDGMDTFGGMSNVSDTDANTIYSQPILSVISGLYIDVPNCHPGHMQLKLLPAAQS